MYGPIVAAGRRILHRYTVAELTAIADFLRRGEQLQLAQAECLLAARHPTAVAAVAAGQREPAPDGATMRRWPGC